MSAERANPLPSPDDDSLADPAASPVERAFVDLMGGPFTKVSITMPENLRSFIAGRVGSRGFSGYVTECVARQARLDALGEFLDELDAIHGPSDPALVQHY